MTRQNFNEALHTIVSHTEIIVGQIDELDEHARGLEATCKDIKIPREARERGESFKRELIAYTQRLERLCISTRGSL